MFKTREEIHNSILLQTKNYLNSKGHLNIKMDHIGYPYQQPSNILGYIPDITSSINSIFQVTEVETRESIGTRETFDQWSAFSNFTNDSNGRFIVNVPKSCIEDAKMFAKKEDIRVDGWIIDPRY